MCVAQNPKSSKSLDHDETYSNYKAPAGEACVEPYLCDLLTLGRTWARKIGFDSQINGQTLWE